MKNKDNLYGSIKSALLISLITLSAYFYFPLPAVSGISLQTVFINLTALTLSPLQGFITVGVWILMGAIGLPVFSGAGGIGKLTGVTGGFYWGFLSAVPVMSIIAGEDKSFKRCLIACFTGVLIEHIMAVAVMCLHNGSDVLAAFQSISLPFIVGDIIKGVLSSMLAVKLNKVSLR